MELKEGLLERLADAARAHGRLGIDTEFMPEGRYKPLLCLVQVVVGDHVEVLDPLVSSFDPMPLAEVARKSRRDCCKRDCKGCMDAPTNGLQAVVPAREPSPSIATTARTGP